MRPLLRTLYSTHVHLVRHIFKLACTHMHTHSAHTVRVHTWCDLSLYLRFDQFLQLGMDGRGEGLRDGGDELVLTLPVQHLLVLQDAVQLLFYIEHTTVKKTPS